MDDGFRDLFFTAEDGLRLHARDYGSTDAARLPLVCLPGLSRNARDFHRFARAVPDRRVVALDYRGRGGSAWDPDPANYTVAVECRDLLTVCAALGIARAVFVGTSRGGLILHVLAAMRPELIAAAVLNDIGPEIEGAGLSEIRDYLGRSGAYPSFEAAADALAGIHGATFPALAREDWLEMAQAIHAERDGRIVPDFDPALTAQLQAIDFGKPLPTLWPQFALLAERPVLAIRGAHSRLLSPATFDRMAAAGARTLTAPGQGHAPLLHRPEVLGPVLAFLDGV
ncbi:alpha/beta fold hydrolase [Shinella pollutisoli]|uniref:Alpha/beta fold hydrolase n=1 Tax=Shinella pollutisoli TaxID=2250594 RepID=A0ABV7DER6_9HYPH|nr:alpha/beta hydrolase [Shinella pollutisoli]